MIEIKWSNDIENAMERNDKRDDLYKKLFIIGGCATFIQLVGVSINFAIKSYLPFLVSLSIGVVCATAITNKYFKAVVYICPNCHTTFKPKLLKCLFAAHTIKTRKLKCPNCHDKNHCLELIKLRKYNHYGVILYIFNLSRNITIK